MPEHSLFLVLVTSEWKGGSESPYRELKAEFEHHHFCKGRKGQRIYADWTRG